MRWIKDKKRRSRLQQELPEAIDLIALVIQAGLDFQVALSHYLAATPSGPLREEFSKVQSEIRTGSSRAEALQHLVERTDSEDLRETARAVIQGIALGSSLAPVLRAQARALRQARAFEAEKRAALAPIQLMFPLFVFIFPTIFVVLFGPVLLAVLKGQVF